MRTSSIVCLLMAAAPLLTCATGCSQQASEPTDVVEISGPPPAAGAHEGEDQHGGDHEGPHGGQVIELGRNHEYHAELVENGQAGSVTVYLLDKEFNELPIDEPSIVINLNVNGEPKTFELTAAETSDGNASRFDTADGELLESLHEHEASSKLRVTINGVPYIAEIEHHDHGDEADGH